ncbi:GNAT family N-acetyltransferase [Croceicoccus sp. YJ47]|uniref:GNAT family N-acetyltransferase n=1 Tax=Croceicoccus sp. YJ47 TaxID=2798724 RepID=UPI0019248B8A|nr:GNAT family N-acetyltransferase [Croceicoccus sp. YJ47]QQN74379.1 GNAT family N-acetyltransferase [Croceicoccus sp. YJ47]
MFEVQEDDLSSNETRELLALHLAGMYSHSPAGNVFALDLTGLQSPEVTVWTARAGNRIAAVGALKMLSDRMAEVKSMRTHPDFLRRGAAAAILETIIDTAADRGVERLSLETGSGDAFEPALTLYRRRGFVKGDAFGDYEESEFNQFLHLKLQEADSRIR